VEATLVPLRAAAIEKQMPLSGDDRVGEAAPRHCSGSSAKQRLSHGNGKDGDVAATIELADWCGWGDSGKLAAYRSVRGLPAFSTMSATTCGI
jgi:hypothetical protein